MATIYLSYKSEDGHLAKRLADELEGLGHRAVYDAVALAPGENWREVLMSELIASDGVVVILTEQGLRSPFIMGEIGAARTLYHEFGQMMLLPVLVGNLPIPEVVNDLFTVRMSADQEGIAQTARGIAKKLEDHITRSRRGHPRVFISHRHKDKEIAEALVKLIEAAFVVEPNDLRCTSVAPYRLRAGDRTNDRLQAEIRRAEAVLGILTPDTKESSYVLFELGASWGRGGLTFPLLARGATLADVPAPIGDLHTLLLYNESECQQLVDDLADVTTLRQKEEPDLKQLITKLVEASQKK